MALSPAEFREDLKTETARATRLEQGAPRRSGDSALKIARDLGATGGGVGWPSCLRTNAGRALIERRPPWICRKDRAGKAGPARVRRTVCSAAVAPV